MNIFKLILVALLISTSVNTIHGQNKIINIDPDDRVWYDSRSVPEKKMHLPDMTVIKNGKHWRFLYDKYASCSFVIDMWGTDSLNCKAFITIYTFGDVKWNNKYKFDKVYHEHIDFIPGSARILYQTAKHVDIGNCNQGHIGAS